VSIASIFKSRSRVMWTLVALAGLYALAVLSLRLPLGRIASENGPPRPDAVYEPSTGAGEVKITHFYPMSGSIFRGDSTSICYGVQRAREVRLEPPVDAVWPAVSHCLSVAPAQSTTYILRATGTDGREVSESIRIQVGPAPPRFVLFSTSNRELVRGEQLTMCYGVENAVKLRLYPVGMDLPPVTKHCIRFGAPASGRYTLTATSAEGISARQEFRVRVR
jgi:hypothetical protein